KALVEAYDADKAILDTYGESTILKRRRDDDDQEGPSAGSDRGSKRQKEGEEPVQTTCQMEEPPHPVFETGADDQPIVQTSQQPEWFSQPRRPPSPDQVYKETTDQLDWVSLEGQHYLHNLLQPLPLISDNRGRRVIPFDHFVNNDLEYLRG
nr:hypothetical protein [Tanacetum cinerariifolium]